MHVKYAVPVMSVVSAIVMSSCSQLVYPGGEEKVAVEEEAILPDLPEEITVNADGTDAANTPEEFDPQAVAAIPEQEQPTPEQEENAQAADEPPAANTTAAVLPTPEQMAAALKMLQEQAAAEAAATAPAHTAPTQAATPWPEGGIAALPPPPIGMSTAATIQPDAPLLPTMQAPRDLPFADEQQGYGMPPRPTLYPAEQRGLRSPELPKLLPMDISGKIHS